MGVRPLLLKGENKMAISEDAKKIIASNLTIAAALFQLIAAVRKKSTTPLGEQDAHKVYKKILEILERS